MVNLAKAVTLTKAQGTARILWASRLGNPAPEGVDTRGVGVVDFVHDRIWITDRLVTDRVAADRAMVATLPARLVGRGVYAFLNWMAGGGREIYYEGAARRKPKRKSGWRSSAIAASAPKHNRHPLCLLDALLEAEINPGSTPFPEVIREVETLRYPVTLTRDLFSPEVWAQISNIEVKTGKPQTGHNAKHRSTAQGFVWLDDRLRIRRMSYESIYDGSDSSTLWSTTEFWDFGLVIDRETPA